MRLDQLSARVSRILGDSLRRRFFGIALTAMTVDLATKAIAVRGLGETGYIPITDRFALTLVWNTGAAGGVSMGPFTAPLSVIMTLLAIGLVLTVVRALANIDPRAVLSLALVTGGAMGNLASVIGGPVGVADFLAIHLWSDITIVANIADLFLWSGALLLAPVALTLVGRAREERAQAQALVADGAV